MQRLIKYFKVPKVYRRRLWLNQLVSKSSAFDASLNRYLWRRLEKSIATYSSCSEKAVPGYVLSVPHYTTGIGHSVMEMNAGMIRAIRWKQRLLYLPIREPWDSFFSFGIGEVAYGDFLAEKPIIIDLPYLPLPEDAVLERRLASLLTGFRSEKKVVFRLFPKTSVYAQSDSAGMLSERYFRRRSLDPVKSLMVESKLNVSIHVRRGDIMAMMADGQGAWRERYVELDYFISLCSLLVELYGQDRLHFHLFSQGNESDFDVFRQFRNVSFYLDYDVFTTFHNLVNSDVLIASPSSFSYLPALLSEGVIVFRSPFWHDLPKKNNWIPIAGDVVENRDAIKTMMRNAIAMSRLGE